MIKLLNDKKGFTLVEVIMSLAVLAIISTSTIICFSNTMLVSMYTQKQIEATAAMRSAKESVTASVKNGSAINQYPSGSKKLRDPLLGGLQSGTSFDLGNKYIFDAALKEPFIPSPIDSNTYTYTITLKKADTGKVIKNMNVKINILKDSGNTP